jgi:hypothetical protein
MAADKGGAMKMKRLSVKVAGVTFEGRQSKIAKLKGDEPCRITPEPDNPYDSNALAVHVATANGIEHVGYVPRDLAREIAPHLEGESIMVKIDEITGGFELFDGGIANYGLVLTVEVPIDPADDTPF